MNLSECVKILVICTKLSPRLIQSLSHHIRLLSNIIPSLIANYLVDWKPLVKELILNIG